MQKNKIVSVWILKYVPSRDRVCRSFERALTFWLWDRLDSPILCEDGEITCDITIVLLLFCLCHFVMWHKRVQCARGNFINIVTYIIYICVCMYIYIYKPFLETNKRLCQKMFSQENIFILTDLRNTFVFDLCNII